MKAISLIQPWASLIAVGEKRIETRSWTTGYRGPIAIHASKKPPINLDIASYYAVLERHNLDPDSMPLGAVVATANLSRVIQIDDQTDLAIDLDPAFPRYETDFGLFAPGRFGWVLTDVVKLPEPIPARGQQGFWEWVQP